jgi:hypothetical protein
LWAEAKGRDRDADVAYDLVGGVEKWHRNSNSFQGTLLLCDRIAIGTDFRKRWAVV